MAKTTKTTELAKKPEAALAVGQNKIDDMFGNTGPQIPIDAPLPTVKILRETPMFETPDGETVKEITGHIIHWHNANQYYSKPFGEGESVIPDCYSSNGINPDGGENMQTCSCRECPLNQYDSAREGRGKACSNTIRLYMLLDGDVIPVLLKAPPSSLGKKESLMKWLTNAPNVASKANCGTAYQPIKVNIKLHKKDFDSGMSASVIDISTVSVLDPTTEDGMNGILELVKLTKQFRDAYLGKVAQYMATESESGETAIPVNSTPVEDDIPI